jgi:hypothetical protein
MKTSTLIAALVAGCLSAGMPAAAFAQTAPSRDPVSEPVTHADSKAAKEQSKADKKAAVAQAKAYRKKTDAQSDADKAAADARVKDAKKQD